MIAESLAGIALVKSAVDGIKSAITTANDIGQIANDIDKLLSGEQQIQKNRVKKQNDPFSITSVAQDTIDAKLAQEQINEVRQMVDLRFGHGTWQGIVVERARRIQEAKEAAAEAKREAVRKHNEFVDTLKFLVGVAALALMVIGLFTFVIMSANAVSP
tara:strand:- start:1967 stop:2443 length:477 start_codon:yes stop_codon:yes gene_type:complete